MRLLGSRSARPGVRQGATVGPGKVRPFQTSEQAWRLHTRACYRPNAVGDRVVPAAVEGMAAQQPAQRQPGTARQAVPLDGFHGVGAAGGREPTARAECGADCQAVKPQDGQGHARAE
jgi:hypothetical protein